MIICPLCGGKLVHIERTDPAGRPIYRCISCGAKWIDLNGEFHCGGIPSRRFGSKASGTQPPPPSCPRCGRSMTIGSPHGPHTAQWECRPCHVYIPIGRSPATTRATTSPATRATTSNHRRMT